MVNIGRKIREKIFQRKVVSIQKRKILGMEILKIRIKFLTKLKKSTE